MGNITLASALPEITTGVSIVGNGQTISGANSYRIFFVDAGSSGSVSISNLTLADGLAHGGIGNSSGGGGAGLGGALFVNTGNVTITDVSFASNSAIGGAGGPLNNYGGAVVGGGGGGGMGGNGGNNSRSSARARRSRAA